jgi:hypothetical protein
MLTRMSNPVIARGTPDELISATELGARIAARRKRQEGWDDDAIRRAVIALYKNEFDDEGYGEYELETLIGAVQRAIDETLTEPHW